MSVKKQFIAPAVLQTVRLELEEDLLVGPSGDLMILAGGHDYEEWNMDAAGYDADVWSTLSD